MLDPQKRGINVALVGIGNCASSLVQGIEHYRLGANDIAGLMHYELGGYRPSDIHIVAAWDVDARKVGSDVSEAIFAKPNCTKVFSDKIERTGAKVRMGRVLDGIADHMDQFPEDRSFRRADLPEATQSDVVAHCGSRTPTS
jgi:myo-inositol-1-phosphate synthase